MNTAQLISNGIVTQEEIDTLRPNKRTRYIMRLEIALMRVCEAKTLDEAKKFAKVGLR